MEQHAKATLVRVVRYVLLLVSLVCFVLAFTRFEDAAAPTVGSPGYRDYERTVLGQARLSVLLGLAGAFALLGFFACGDWAKRLDGPPGP